MYQLTDAQLSKMGGVITTNEIKQQPELWQETFENFTQREEEIRDYLQKIQQKSEGKRLRVIFTGAGTSAYVGETILPYLRKNGQTDHFWFEAIPTTDIVASPLDYLKKEEPTILVSFARSGNSPESLKTVALADEIVTELHHIIITCAPDGQLAQRFQHDPDHLLLMMPAGANDQGFAMTGSFTCMTFTALLVFDTSSQQQKAHYLETMVEMGHQVIQREAEIAAYLSPEIARIVYLGSGSLAGLTREAQLKVLELTAGKIATVFDSSLGFRHGPKSFVDEQTLVLVFVGNDPYTRQYDLDILNEIQADQIAKTVVAIQQHDPQLNFEGKAFTFENTPLPEAYVALPFLMVAQTLALLASIQVGNTPDTPSPTGTVNRVVKGVSLHPFVG